MMTGLTMVRITDPVMFFQYESAIGRLLERFKHVLADDFTVAENLVKNTATCIPYLWLLVQPDSGAVAGIASLTDVIPGRHAFVHGVAHPLVRKYPQVQTVINDVLREAFETLGVYKLKAEFDADNRGAKGFCLRMGFTREAVLKADTRRQGRMQDALIYTLFADRYFQKRRDQNKNAMKEKNHVSGT